MDQQTRPAPASAYRLQLHADFTFDDAAAQVPYLASLGVTHLFCSPILQAAPGSRHGYDVVDHHRISEECGGQEGFLRLAATAREHGLGLILDVVPNHMAVPTPLWHNRALWDVLRQGPASPFAHWFDLDLSEPVLMPVLGHRIGQELEAGSISVQRRQIAGSTEQAEPVVVYHDHVFPVRPGTEDLPIAELLEQQWYRLAYWKVGSDELNYRRFFDVDTLAAVRVEDPDVFRATHQLVLDLHAQGLIDGFRIDHPDGLANPRQYLADLQQATGGCWVVVEKILEPAETLPETFQCAGTTGYDALLRVSGIAHDPAALPRLTDLWERVSGSSEGFAATLTTAKNEVVRTILFTEVNRLTTIAVAICESDIRLRDHTRRQLNHAIRELLVAMDRYRAYLEPGQVAAPSEREVITEAADRARTVLAEDELDSLDLIVAFACGDVDTSGPEAAGLRAEFMIRFAQTCGPVMAKSKEDTAFYRWNRFAAVNEVGSEPTLVGVSPDSLHDFCEFLNRSWPTTMTTLSTHDTKRSEDVRARLAAQLEHAREWETCVAELRAATEVARGELVDGATELLLWQTLAACWALPGTSAGRRPILGSRLADYLVKAMREAKVHTAWTDPNEAYETAVLTLARAALADERVVELLDAFTTATAASVRTTLLGQKLLQLTMPGVPDVYQGCEIVDVSLVDPDNRRPVDYEVRRELLASVDAAAAAVAAGTGTGQAGLTLPSTLDAEKLLVTSRALRLRREHPDAFRGELAEYRPVPTTTGHAVAFSRGVAGAEQVTAVTILTRQAAALTERGGWGDHTVILPPGTFLDGLSGQRVSGGETLLSELLDTLPVALLTPVARGS